VRARLDISYDGTDFSGWAVQPGRRTVCGVLNEGLSTLVRRPVSLTVAGRTDAGVHALGQVAHVDLPGEVDLAELTRRLGRLLPPDVRVRSVTTAPTGFDARFSALRRHYRYRISVSPYGAEPLRARDTVSWPHACDIDAMNTAAAGLLGEHDFASYCKRRDGATTIRELQRCEWVALGPAEPGVLACEVSADAFCHSMVRSLVGALLAVGRGQRETAWPAALLTRSERAGDVTVRVELVAPDGEIWSGMARMVIAKTLDGDLGILTGHPPVIGILADGSLVRILDVEDGPAESQEEVRAAVSSGFLSVTDDRVSILVRQAELGFQVEVAAARARLDSALSEAGQLPSGEQETLEVRYSRALLRAAGDQS